MNQNIPTEPKPEEKPAKVRWLLCLGMAVLMASATILAGYFASDLLLALSHLSPWVSLPIYAIGWLLVGLYILLEMLNMLGGAYTLFTWGRDTCKRLAHYFVAY